MNIKYIGDDIPWSLPFGDHFNPSNQVSFTQTQKQTSELEAIARRHDFEPLYSNNDQLAASGKNSKWMNAGVFFTNKNIDSDLRSIHQTDFHDDHKHTFCYLCSINGHEHDRTEPRDESRRRKLIPYKNPRARLSSSSDRIVHDSSSSDLISYRFIVRTGTRKNSGTRAQVFLYIYGTENNWTSINLQTRTNQTIDGFPSGSNRTFCLQGPDIGQLHHLNVNLVGSRSDKEWFLEEIEITNLNTSVTWLCEFNCWLPKTNEQDNQIKPSLNRATELSVYILQVRTGKKPFAGTDSTVQIIVHGSLSQTRRLALTSNRANLFEQNQLDTFAILGSDIGDLLEIVVESDRSQFASDWDIKVMTMWKIIPSDHDKQFYVYFPFNTWLGKKVSTLKAKQEKYPLVDHHLKGPICYQVIVKTGKVMNAGTDANVFLIIYGKSGLTVIHQLNNRLKNDFEKNSISEFTIMDIDVGKIDRIKIWHDNSGAGSAWFLESIIIRKKHSISHTVSNIYIQRLEQISQALYRQAREQSKKNLTVRSPSTNENERRSVDRKTSKSKEYDDYGLHDRSGSSRSILRSPTMYDKASLHKKVTWDEQSIGSQDDSLSIETQRVRTKPNISEQKRTKEETSHHESGHFDHHVYWISSHNYIDNKWQIKSIEEMNSFNLDQSTRSLLLSDRATIHDKIKTPTHENVDETYEFEANRWLAKDKEDGKLEVYLTPKLIHETKHKSSIQSETVIDSKKKHLIPSYIHSDSQHQKYEDDVKESKHSASHDLGPIERSLKGLNPRDLRSSASHLSDMSKTQPNDPRSFQRNTDSSSRQIPTPRRPEDSSRIDPSIDRFSLTSSYNQRLKSPRSTNDLTTPLTGEREFSARISREPPYQSRSSANSLLPPSHLSKSPRNTNDFSELLTSERESLLRMLNEPSNLPRSSATSLPPSNRLSKPAHSTNDLTTPLTSERELLARISREPPHHPQSSATSLLSSNQRLESSRRAHHLDSSLTSERESSNHPRSLTTPMSPSDRFSKAPRSNNDLTTPLTSERESLARISREPPHHPRSSATSLLSSNQRLESPHRAHDLDSPLTSERDSLAKISRESSNHPRSSATSLPPSNRLSKSLHSTKDLSAPLTSERELLTRNSREPTYDSRSSAASLLPPSRLSKSHRVANDLTQFSGERGSLVRLSDERPNSPRSSATSLLSSSQYSKPTRLNNESTSSLERISSGPLSKPKSSRSNLELSSQKSIRDQVYGSAYGTAPSDDF